MPAKNGDTVRVHYAGTLDDGSEFDNSREREPMEITLGGKMLISGFENALLGMEPGEKITVRIPPEEAYGPVNEEARVSVPLTQFPPHLKPEIGMTLQVTLADGAVADMQVIEVNEEAALLDANHPLAGQALTFEIELLEIL